MDLLGGYRWETISRYFMHFFHFFSMLLRIESLRVCVFLLDKDCRLNLALPD